jgi:sensor histidine kinase regulating citrate/malate metabolism
MVNYVLTDFSAKCTAAAVDLQCTVELEAVTVDEIMLCSILSNALENALLNLPEQEDRYVRVMLKTVDGRLLISVKNPTAEIPTFVDGLPIPSKENHGYGTRSICYITEKLGGNCQFSVNGNVFVVRVVI